MESNVPKKKRALRYRSKIQPIKSDGARQPAIEPAELLLMMETLSRWVCYDHRHKTFLSKELLWIAARAINLRADATHWSMHRDWPLIAFMIGIDTKYFNVIDPTKFKWFWWQLGENGKFSIKLQKQLLTSGKEPPEMEPLIITKPYWTPKVKQQKLHAQEVKEYQDSHLKTEIMEHFFV